MKHWWSIVGWVFFTLFASVNVKQGDYWAAVINGSTAMFWLVRAVVLWTISEYIETVDEVREEHSQKT